MGGDVEANRCHRLRISEIPTWVALIVEWLRGYGCTHSCFSDENARADMKKLPTLPTKVLKEHPSLAYWYAHRKRFFKNITLCQLRSDKTCMATRVCICVCVCVCVETKLSV